MAGLIPPATLEQIRAANDIVDVIGSVLPLKRAGANFVALCPFHKEKSPSFNVNPHKQIFHCFGCHKGGDVFTFIREYEGLSFIEAVAAWRKENSDRVGGTRRHGANPFVKGTLLQLHEQITQQWQRCPRCGDVARRISPSVDLTDRAVSLAARQMRGMTRLIGPEKAMISRSPKGRLDHSETRRRMLIAEVSSCFSLR
jgi:DNA primase